MNHGRRVLNGCSDVNNNPACDRLTVSGAFFGSPEFSLKGLFAYRFYKLAFNRLPLYSEIVVDMRAVTGATPAETFQKKATFTNNFVLRTEFVNLFNALDKHAVCEHADGSLQSDVDHDTRSGGA